MQLRTLGGLSLEGSTFQRPKPLLLLSFLALEGPCARKELADLFFRDAKDPKDSLTTAIGRLRTATNGLIETNRTQVTANVPCDAVQLLNELESGAVAIASEAFPGMFLKGIDVPLGVELEEWVYGTREAIAERSREALLKRAESEAARGSFVEAARLAEGAYLLSGAPELTVEVLERVYVLLVAGGNHKAVEVSREAEGLGAVPGVTQQQARDSLTRLAISEEAMARTNLTAPSTKFFGREKEKQELSRMVASEATRLITILGAGGLGKSRLAVNWARDQLRLGRFPDGVYLVQLEAVAGGGNIPQAVADALEVRLLGDGTLLDQVSRYVGDQRILLILDNFEHLVDEAEVVSMLLRRCRGVSIIATSRQRLGVPEESLFALKGLDYPEQDDTYEDAIISESLSLFISRARLKDRGFSISEGDLAAAVRICGLVEGMPLGIELSASLTRMLSLESIAEEIGNGAEVLQDDVRGIVERHRSIRATFEHSWNLLTAKERDTLCGLIVFKDGFRRAAASAVLGVTLPALGRLVDKSLLGIGEDGRYEIHPLLRQFIEEKAARRGSEAAAVNERHSEYYLGLVTGLDDELTGGAGVKRAALAIEEELPNLTAAVAFAVGRGRHRRLAKCLETLAQFSETRSRYREVAPMVNEILAAVDGVEGLKEVNGSAVAVRALLKYRSGNNREAVEDGLRAAALLEPSTVGNARATWLAWYTAGLCSRTLGRPQDAATFHARARQGVEWEIAEGITDRAYLKHAKMRLGFSLQDIGLTDLYYANLGGGAAEELLGTAVHLYKEVESPYVSLGMMFLAEYYMARREYGTADELMRTALGIATQIGYKTGVNNITANLAKLRFQTGDLEEAIRLSDEIVAQARRVGDKWAETYACSARGWAALEQQDYAVADANLKQSIEAAVATQSYVYVMEPLLGVARLRFATGHERRGEQLLELVLRHPATPTFVRRSAAEYAATIGFATGAEQHPLLLQDAAERQLERVTLGLVSSTS